MAKPPADSPTPHSVPEAHPQSPRLRISQVGGHIKAQREAGVHRIDAGGENYGHNGPPEADSSEMPRPFFELFRVVMAQFLSRIDCSRASANATKARRWVIQ